MTFFQYTHLLSPSILNIFSDDKRECYFFIVSFTMNHEKKSKLIEAKNHLRESIHRIVIAFEVLSTCTNYTC